MKTGFLLILSVCLLFSSCANNTENHGANDQRIADSLTGDFQDVYDKALSECEKLTADSTYKHLFSAFCPSDTMEGPPISRYKKYPFDTLITKTKDTITCSFKVTNVCCKTYYSRFRLNADTLILSYYSCGTTCDCHCDYTLTYKIPVKTYPHKHIRLETDEYLPFNN